MKKYFTVIIILISMTNASFIKNDKVKHIGAGIVAYTFFKEEIFKKLPERKKIVYSTIGVLVIAIGKELIDSYGYGNPEIEDIGATMLGTVIPIKIIDYKF